MSWLRTVLAFRRGDYLQDVAAGIASQNRPEIWERVWRRARTMGLAEASGYIRARSAGVIHAEVDIAISRDPNLDPSERDQLIRLATDIAVTGAVDQLLEARRTGASRSAA